MSELEKLVEEQKLRLKKIRDKVQHLTEEIHTRKSNISTELFTSTKDKMLEFSPTVFSEVQNMLLEEISKSYEAIVREKEKVIQQLQKDIEEVTNKYTSLDSLLKEQVSRVSTLSVEKDKSVLDLLKKVSEINKQQELEQTSSNTTVILEQPKCSGIKYVESHFNLLSETISEVLRFFRNTLGVVSEALEIAKEEINGHPANKRVLLVKQQIERIVMILNKLKEVLKIPTGEMQKIELRKIISFVLSKYQDIFKAKGVEVIQQIPADDFVVIADKDFLIEVFSEIINNSLEAYLKSTGNQLTVKVYKEDGKINIKFSDNGCGVAEHLLSKLSHLFFTTKVETEHFGLGLFKVKWYLKMFDANFSINSVFGKGTEVSIIFN